MALTVIGAQGSSNSNVFLRMNAPDVTSYPNAGGTVNCAWGVGPEELFEVSLVSGGTTTTIQSVAFPNCFLRVDAPAGVVNCQFTAASWEQFNLQPQSGGMAIQSNQWTSSYLSMDGTGVASTSTPGGSVSVGSSGGTNETFIFYTDLAIGLQQPLGPDGLQQPPFYYLRLAGQPGGVVNCQVGASLWEQYHLESQGSGTVAIKSKQFGVYLQMDGTGLDASQAGVPGTAASFGSSPGPNGAFQIVRLSNGGVAIESVQFPGVYLGMNGAGQMQPLGPGCGSAYAVYYGDASSVGTDASLLIEPQVAAIPASPPAVTASV
jgi:phospholipase C